MNHNQWEKLKVGIMKKLIVINGTMGVGKTSTCNKLNEALPKSVFLDGDWCWNMNPFVVTDETKEMVTDNISYLLNSYINCSEFENIIFCWVIHREEILEEIITKLDNVDYELHFITLICSEEKLRSRLVKDVENEVREWDIIDRSIKRLQNYVLMSSKKIDVSDIEISMTVEKIRDLIVDK